VVRGGKLLTPPLGNSVLAGITRDSVLTVAQELGIPVVEQILPREVLYISDEVFFTGTAAEVTPIREVDDRKVGEGTRGPVTKEIQGTFFSAARGEVERYASWLTYVND
jgi:branched-chain amino acid aminotransferase